MQTIMNTRREKKAKNVSRSPRWSRTNTPVAKFAPSGSGTGIGIGTPNGSERSELSSCSIESLPLSPLRFKVPTVPPRIIVVTPGEDAAEVWSERWTDKFVKGTGFHQRFDLNYRMDRMATYLKRRVADFQLDPPLTVMGYETSKLLGKALAEALIGPKVALWVSSPELRCMQTLAGIYEGANWDFDRSRDKGIAIRKDLCSYFGGSSRHIPHFCTADKFKFASKEGQRASEDGVTTTSPIRVNWRYYSEHNSWDPTKADGDDFESEESYKQRFMAACSAVEDMALKKAVVSIARGGDDNTDVTVVCVSKLNQLSLLAGIMHQPFPDNKMVARYLQFVNNLSVAQFDYDARTTKFMLAKPIVRQVAYGRRAAMEMAPFMDGQSQQSLHENPPTKT